MKRSGMGRCPSGLSVSEEVSLSSIFWNTKCPHESKFKSALDAC